MKRSYIEYLEDIFRVSGSDLRGLLEEHLAEGMRLGSHLVQMILDSRSVVQQEDNDWEFKSIAAFAREEFCRSSPIGIGVVASKMMEGDESPVEFRVFLRGVAQQYGNCIVPWLYYIPEGLRLYVENQNGEFTEAGADNQSWRLVSSLIENSVAIDDEMYSPPRWAEELHIGRRNYDAYCAFYHDHDLADPMFNFSKQLRRSAIYAYTDGVLGSDADNTPGELPQELDIAVKAYSAIRGNESLTKRKTPKQALIAWLKEHHPELSEGALERIATVANWQPMGGAPRQA